MSDPTKKTRVILVDDHPAVLRQTMQLLPERFEIVDTSEDGLDLLNSVRELQPDVIVLDITLPMMSGTELARRLRTAGFQTKIVFLTVHADPDYLVLSRLLRAESAKNAEQTSGTAPRE